VIVGVARSIVARVIFWVRVIVSREKLASDTAISKLSKVPPDVTKKSITTGFFWPDL